MAQFAIDEIFVTGLQISGQIYDVGGNLGAAGQSLTASATGVVWSTISAGGGGTASTVSATGVTSGVFSGFFEFNKDLKISGNLNVTGSVNILTLNPGQYVKTNSSRILTTVPNIAGPDITGAGSIFFGSGANNSIYIISPTGYNPASGNFNVVIDTAQDIRRVALPTFSGLILSNLNNNQYVKTSGNGILYTVPKLFGADITGAIPDGAIPGAVMLTGNQTVADIKTFTSQMIVSNGTLNSPSIAFNGDTSHGIYFLSSNTVNTGFTIVTNATRRMLFTSTGSIGINNDVPVFNLDVSGSGRFSGPCKGANGTLPNEFVTKAQLDATGALISAISGGGAVSTGSATLLFASGGNKSIYINPIGYNPVSGTTTITFDTVQNLAPSGIPTFGGLTLTGNITYNSTPVVSKGRFQIAPGAVLSDNGSDLVISGGFTSTISNTGVTGGNLYLMAGNCGTNVVGPGGTILINAGSGTNASFGNILLATINTGKVGFGITNPLFAWDFTGTARFNNRVKGATGVNSDEFVTKGQLDITGYRPLGTGYYHVTNGVLDANAVSVTSLMADIGLFSALKDGLTPVAGATYEGYKYLKGDQTWGTPFEPACSAVSVTNVSSLSGLPTVDGVTLASGDFILLVGQTNPVENGPWLVAAGAWTRTFFYYTGSFQDALEGRVFKILKGAKYSGTEWYITSTGFQMVDSTSVTFSMLPINAPGASGQVLYNFSGTISGAVNVSIDASGSLVLGDYLTSKPPNPTSGASLFSTNKGGRRRLTINDPFGESAPLSDHFALRNIKWVKPRGNSTTLDSNGITATVSGVAYSAPFNTSMFRTTANRIGYSGASTGIGESAGITWSSAQFTRGISGWGGFEFICRFSFPQQQPLWRWACGMFNTSSTLTNIQPSGNLNMACVGFNSGDTDVRFMTNAGTALATMSGTSLGSTINTGSVYEYRLYCPPSSPKLYMGFGRIDPGFETWAEYSTTGNLMGATNSLTPQIWVNNGTGGQISVEVMSMVCESFI